MELINQFINNKIVQVAFVSWFFAQFFKILTFLFVEKKLNLKRFFESGGMPSSHTALVIAATYAVGHVEGVSSTLFAISLMFSVIIMYDATGVRQAAGIHAKLLNQIVDSLENTIKFKLDKRLKELLGHTPFEVLWGLLLGLTVGYFMCTF